MLRAKPSMRAAWAASISAVQSNLVWPSVRPTYGNESDDGIVSMGNIVGSPDALERAYHVVSKYFPAFAAPTHVNNGAGQKLELWRCEKVENSLCTPRRPPRRLSCFCLL